jgi:hypothetical protein
MPSFVPGLRLNAEFYAQVVAPLLAAWPHAAARLGSGSEVLSFDTERSTDHGWGPRLEIFVEDGLVGQVEQVIDDGLPESFAGWPVRYGWDEVLVTHHVTVSTLKAWLTEQLGVDPTSGLSTTDWLLIPQQKLLEVTGGAVFRDDRGALERLRQQLSWYPTQVWIWMLAAQWRRIAEEEAFVGRTAEVGDELGSRLVAARLARELMRMWFLLAQAFWPYTKWFGTAFARLRGSQRLGEALQAALAATEHAERETALTTAYELVAHRHNEVGVTAAVDPHSRPFYMRPYRVLGAERFVEACLDRLDDADLRECPLVGSVDQLADSTDLLSYPERSRRLAALYSRDG